MRKQIAIALAQHIGKPLTPEVAVAIARELCDSQDKTPDTKQFPPQNYGEYLIQAELVRDSLPELHLLHERHYLETELHRASIPLNPDYDAVLDREHQGGLLQFTARVEATGELVGNMRVYLSQSIHTQTLVCTEDTFYLVPEHRGGFLAVRLWQYVERWCIAIGVREIYFDSKTINSADSMARYLGYKPVAIKFAKVF
ncbi:GNAT family N-acetyltransferase [Undibacterium umbellatum]|uniref:GNAT family N-acetyltransferase n=1 Tax=Undibacterium umbellatum TaxID=2762300 RepID=A0ABR6Z3K5_9BURK|nr:GNAT family N-acetyltransferase [Undibacterium umbellatum]MBC3906194.1 GNAT family N-acetyltransferase [Undibacterium umbellatum]